MEKQKAEIFKNILNNQLLSLRHEMESTMNEIGHDDEVYADWTDVASAETDKSVLLKIRNRERMLMTKISDALKRIELGSYGICESCEEEISETRLKARPVTTLCIDCKQELEGQEHKHRFPI